MKKFTTLLLLLFSIRLYAASPCLYYPPDTDSPTLSFCDNGVEVVYENKAKNRGFRYPSEMFKNRIRQKVESLTATTKLSAEHLNGSKIEIWFYLADFSPAYATFVIVSKNSLKNFLFYLGDDPGSWSPMIEPSDVSVLGLGDYPDHFGYTHKTLLGVPTDYACSHEAEFKEYLHSFAQIERADTICDVFHYAYLFGGETFLEDRFRLELESSPQYADYFSSLSFNSTMELMPADHVLVTEFGFSSAH